MVGACIPVLRVLIRDVRTQYVTDDSSCGPKPIIGLSWKGIGATATSSASRVQKGDDWSDKSILSRGTAVDRGGILRTNEVDVDYQAQKDGGVNYHSKAFELQEVRSV